MRRLGLLLLLGSAPAGADTRLDLEPIPELSLLEPAFQVNRDEPAPGLLGSIGLGWGRFDHDDRTTAVGSFAIGKRTDRVFALADGELVAAGRGLWRGRHRGLLELRTPDHADGIAGSVTLETALDHGEAPGLAPVSLGQGRRSNAELEGEAVLHLGKEHGDFVWVAELFGELGVTRWEAAPALDGADRRSLGLGLGQAPSDGNAVRGTINFLRGRVEHVTIRRPIIGAGSGPALPSTAVRLVELGSGAHEMTLMVDHEVLAIVSGEVGWSWLEADTAAGRLEDNMFRMRVGAAMKWQHGRKQGSRRLGIAFAREPGYTPDGQRLVSDSRVELELGAEDARYVVAAQGGISWIRAIEGGPPAPILNRYGSHLEAFYKLGGGLELGGYHATTFEAQLAGDPWASPRRWGTELGVLVRWRRGERRARKQVFVNTGDLKDESPLPPPDVPVLQQATAPGDPDPIEALDHEPPGGSSP